MPPASCSKIKFLTRLTQCLSFYPECWSGSSPIEFGLYQHKQLLRKFKALFPYFQILRGVLCHDMFQPMSVDFAGKSQSLWELQMFMQSHPHFWIRGMDLKWKGSFVPIWKIQCIALSFLLCSKINGINKEGSFTSHQSGTDLEHFETAIIRDNIREKIIENKNNTCKENTRKFIIIRKF